MIPDHGPADIRRHSGAQPSLGWSEFSDSLQNLDLVLHDARERFTSRVVDNDFGALKLRNVGSRGGALRGERTPSRIDTHREELVWVCVVLNGDMRITQQNATAELAAGDFAIVDALRPYVIEIPSSPVDTLWIGSPRALLANHIWDMDELLATRIDGRSGAGQIASRVLCAGFAEPEALPGDQANRIADGLLGVLGAAIDGCRLRQTGSHYHAAIARRIKHYIEAHLGDETLTVARIANAQGLSPRYLAKIFETEAQTVSGWIWSRRLERCHAALLQAAGRTSITDIAYDHGFKNVSHFSRAFRERYGVSPRALSRSTH